MPTAEVAGGAPTAATNTTAALGHWADAGPKPGAEKRAGALTPPQGQAHASPGPVSHDPIDSIEVVTRTEDTVALYPSRIFAKVTANTQAKVQSYRAAQAAHIEPHRAAAAFKSASPLLRRVEMGRSGHLTVSMPLTRATPLLPCGVTVASAGRGFQCQ